MSLWLFLVLFVGFWTIVCTALVKTGVVRLRVVDDVRPQLGGLAKPIYDPRRLKGIRVKCPTSLAFAIRPEDEHSARMRQAGELREIQTGDFAFDEKLFLECEDTRVGDWLRGDREARQLIAALVGKERTLELRRGKLRSGRGS